ncbi:MAG: hypothetical protein NTX50_01045 [Candidatus Sumerlaeota bacterium]|nr:hypothetical protein [Candidatus Sumerlaeota bacterium]
MTKKTRYKKPPHSIKSIRFDPAAQPIPENRKPAWKFSRMDFEGPFGWTQFDTNQWKYLFNKLSNFESMTWEDIKRVPSCHYIDDLHKISKAARDRLTEINLDMMADYLFQLALSGKERIFGLLMDQYFKFLWWDPEHKVCPWVPPHT